MFTASGGPAAVSSLPAWNILFAREPEPDLEVDETVADLDETAPADDEGGDSQGPEDDKKPKMIKLVLLAAVAGAGLYVAIDPGILMGPAEDPPPASAPPAPQAAHAPATLPNPDAPPTAMAPPAAAQAPSSALPPQALPTAPSAPAQPKSPMPAMASAPSPAMPSAMSPAPPKPAPAASTGFSPLFREGQPVVILADPTKPTGPVSLMADPGSSRPGPTVAANTAATVQDGELRNNSWVYSIRTTQGATGWISEKQLQAKP
ncbi:MAG: hypothetical protein FJ245_09250 [Nitrospira sp.]|nr:hypothetical protein [Nitrospira sp.]